MKIPAIYFNNAIMTFQAFRRNIDVMSEDYVIEWDKIFCRRPQRRRQRYFIAQQPYGPLFSLNFRRSLKSLKTKMKTNMGCRTGFWIVAVAISGNNDLAQAFYKFYAARLIHLVDWKV